MSTRITTADARKKFSDIINHAAFGKESIILMRRGEVVRLMLYPIFF
jgi:antitoxin (DNA-binding transcriptional repressor) of toxin-antitoxin stability system